MNAHGPLNGYLLARVDGANVSAFDLEACPNLEHQGKISGTEWDEYSFYSPVHFAGEHAQSSAPPFQYTIVCRHSGPRLLMLAHRRQITDYLIDHELQEYIFPNLQRVPIDVATIVKMCLEHAFGYKLTAAHGRFNGSGGALRSSSFYGEDLSKSEVFQEVAANFDFYSCGLGKARVRHNDSAEGNAEHGRQGEIVRLGNDGFVSVFLRDARRAQAVEAALRYLKKLNLIRT